MQPVIYVDLRCLQDPSLQYQLIGSHTAALLRARKRSALSNSKIIGLKDPRLPNLPTDLSSLVDEISSDLNPCFSRTPSIFIDPSPMTYDTRFGIRFQNDPNILRAAAVPGCVALQSPECLATVASRIEYTAKLAQLVDFDLLFPTSGYMASQLSSLVGASSSRIYKDPATDRFWGVIATAIEKRKNPAVALQARKPRLAFLAYPPDDSLAARYTDMTMAGGEAFFHSNKYTTRPCRFSFEINSRNAGQISLAPFVAGAYDGIVTVLDGSAAPARMLEIFDRYGGPCIVHDCGVLPSAFVERIVRHDSPLIVHSVKDQVQIQRLYGADAHVTTCCPTLFFRDEQLTTSAKQLMRQRLGIASGAFLIVSFGRDSYGRDMRASMFAIELLRSWHVPVKLFHIGSPRENEAFTRISADYGVAEHVHFLEGTADEIAYRDLLIASDAAVHVQTSKSGQLPIALLNCISAGLPCVTTLHLAEWCNAPQYVTCVPDIFSPLQIAEQLAEIAQQKLASHINERVAYLETHNFEYYAKRLVEILGVS